MRCIICGLEKEASKEHIIPDALGNKKFITYKVCEECNNKLGANVDNYLTDHIIVKIIRKELRLLGKEEQEIKIFPSSATDNSGQKYIFREDTPIKPPVAELKDGVLHIEAESIEQAINLARKRLKRSGFSNEKIEEIIKDYQCKDIQEYQPTFQLPADVDKGRYLLAGIKIAYEFACEILGDLYREDEIATLFRKELYKAVKVNKKELSSTIDYHILKMYAGLLHKESSELKNIIASTRDKIVPKPRHVCLLHDSADHKLICEVILLFEDIVSFTVMISEDATRYGMQGTCKVAMVLEDGSLISC